MDYEIKKCEYDELVTVAHMYNQLSYELKEISGDEYFDFSQLSDHTMLRVLRNAIKECDLIIYVAKCQGKVIGFISGSTKPCFLPASNTKEVGYIEGAFVEEQCRRSKVLSSLEEVLCEEFKRRGVYFIELNILQNNEVARSTWMSRGYETFREQMRKKI